MPGGRGHLSKRLFGRMDKGWAQGGDLYEGSGSMASMLLGGGLPTSPSAEAGGVGHPGLWLLSGSRHSHQPGRGLLIWPRQCSCFVCVQTGLWSGLVSDMSHHGQTGLMV